MIPQNPECLSELGELWVCTKFVKNEIGMIFQISKYDTDNRCHKQFHFGEVNTVAKPPEEMRPISLHSFALCSSGWNGFM